LNLLLSSSISISISISIFIPNNKEAKFLPQIFVWPPQSYLTIPNSKSNRFPRVSQIHTRIFQTNKPKSASCAREQGAKDKIETESKSPSDPNPNPNQTNSRKTTTYKIKSIISLHGQQHTASPTEERRGVLATTQAVGQGPCSLLKRPHPINKNVGCVWILI